MTAPQSAVKLTLCAVCDPLRAYATEYVLDDPEDDDGVPDGVGWPDAEDVGPDGVAAVEVAIEVGLAVLDGTELAGVVGVGFGTQAVGTHASWNSNRSPGWNPSIVPAGTDGSSGAAA
jgi:hypothetical protein